MKIYTLRNNDGEYISTAIGQVTDNWFDALKFPFSDITKNTRYIDPSFKLVEYEVIEVYEYGSEYRKD